MTPYADTMSTTDANAAVLAAVIDDFGNRVVPFYMDDALYQRRQYFYFGWIE